MGFPGYFLIVMEFIQWSKDNGVPVGPGRGSGAGSLVAYALKITDLDPLEFDLLFERFLNPERVSMPDFDVDFCMEKRDRLSSTWRICTAATRYRRSSPSAPWRRKRSSAMSVACWVTRTDLSIVSQAGAARSGHDAGESL